MGIFDSFFTKEGFEVQLKAGEPGMDRYEIGDPCELPEGVYHALDNDAVIIRGGVVIDVGPWSELSTAPVIQGLTHFDKWGQPFTKESDNDDDLDSLGYPKVW